MFSFELQHEDIETKARAGIIKTPHGEIHTPIFMLVGTVGSVKSLSPNDLNNAVAEIIIGHTSHLYLRQGIEVL